MTEEEQTSYPSLVEKAYVILREDIIRGDLGAGYPLLEQEIADRLEMSRTPVRVAIERLKHDGLVELIKRKGMLVKPLTITDVKQAYEVAEGLEGMLVKLVTLQASAEELEELRSCAQAMVTSAEVGDVQQWIISDQHFHRQLLAFARNPLMETSLSRIMTVIERVRFFHMNTGTIQMSSAEHLAMVEAMVKHDAEQARQLHQAHWQRVREEIIAQLQADRRKEVRMHT